MAHSSPQRKRDAQREADERKAAESAEVTKLDAENESADVDPDTLHTDTPDEWRDVARTFGKIAAAGAGLYVVLAVLSLLLHYRDG